MSASVKSSAARSTGKRSRKPYVITRPRERWTADEHDRFLHALPLFGRDWKRVQAFVATKTATQIRSHAQKHFLRAHKKALGLGLGAGAVAPPPHRGSSEGHRQQRPLTGCPAWWLCGDDDGGGASAAPAGVETVVQLPVSPDDPHFAQVYRFVGDVFGSGAPRPVEAQLHRLLGAHPVIVDTILRVLANLQDNLSL